MKRHCPRCGKPTAIVVTSQQLATRMGAVTEEAWRCEDCFHHFKLHSPKWDALWIVFAIAMFGCGVMTSLGYKVKPDQRDAVTALVFAMALASGIYAAILVRTRKKARLVSAA